MRILRRALYLAVLLAVLAGALLLYYVINPDLPQYQAPS